MVKIKYLILIVFMLLFSSEVFALGISPSKLDLEFEPNKKYDINFVVINSVDKPFPVSVSFSGELNDYANFKTQEIVLNPKEERLFTIHLKLPKSFDKPGNHEASIVVSQTDILGDLQGGAIGATVAVVSPVNVFVSYNGPYLDADFEGHNAEQGEKVPFYISIRNLGNGPIEQIDGIITVFDSLENNIGEVKFNEVLGAEQASNIIVLWDSSDNPSGVYKAKLKLTYSEGEFEADTEFRLGSYFVDILKLPKVIEKGVIDEYEVSLISNWNEIIKNIYIDLGINYNNQPFNFKSESFDLKPWENKTVKMFVDARNMEEGIYPAHLSIFYGNSSNVVDFDIEIKEKDDTMIYIGIGIGVIILILIFVIIWGKFLKKKRKK